MPRDRVAYPIPADAPRSDCHACEQDIYWVKHRNGRDIAVDPDGRSHDCPEAPRKVAAPKKYEIPPGTAVVQCKGCQALIAWVTTPAGKSMPVDADGTPHWATCPKAKDFKRG